MPNSLGSRFSEEESQAQFLIWAPKAEQISLHLVHPRDRLIPLNAIGDGFHEVSVSDCPEGSRYFYRINGQDRPDPASRFQPDGVHGASQVLSARPPRPGWKGIALEEYVIYELHIGTFTEEGTFAAAIRHLTRLRDLGITAIEIMPVAEFPGNRNWGYDGACLFAVESSYGGPDGLREFVAACHQEKLAVVLDVVYNHLGPEGNYLSDFGPYFTDAYRTPWGSALNFDGPQSDGVRRFFLENALYWIEEFGIDALRLDAVHAIYDNSAYPFLRELADCVHEKGEELGRRAYLIAESDLNDSKVVTRADVGGFGLDAQWADDLHHALHCLLTGECRGYYRDFGTVTDLEAALQHGWKYSGQYSPSRERRFGNSPASIEAHQLVVCSQNHDQIGNRMNGDRLVQLAGANAARLAAACVILSPYIPLLFMGEEYAETAPFLYFTSHSDPELRRAVQEGRKKEFADFHQEGGPPDPQQEETFYRSKLHPELASLGDHQKMFQYYCELLRLRKEHPVLRSANKKSLRIDDSQSEFTSIVRRLQGDQEVVLLLNFGRDEQEMTVRMPRGNWRLLLDSSDVRWGGSNRVEGWDMYAEGEEIAVRVAAKSCLAIAGSSLHSSW